MESKKLFLHLLGFKLFKMKQRQLFSVLQRVPAKHSEIPATIVFERVLDIPMALDHHVTCRRMPRQVKEPQGAA